MKKDAIRGLRAALSFLTILPVGHGNIEEMAEHAYFFPIVGFLIGLISGSLGYLLFLVLPPPLAGIMTHFLLLLITGFNQLDGVLDLGDALMFRGTKEKRIEILHDKNHGIGGITALYFLLSTTSVTIILTRNLILPALIVSETYAKLSMVVGGVLGRPHVQGIGRTFILKIKERTIRNLTIGVATSAIIALLLGTPTFMSVTLIFILVFSIFWTRKLNATFGCITGDMLGCMSEISRLLCLLLFLYFGAF